MASKETEKAPQPEAAPDATTMMERLHDEYLRGLASHSDQVERQLDEALRSSMTAISVVEEDLAQKTREAMDEYVKACQGQPAGTPNTAAWFTYQKKVSDISIAARQKEAEIRERYLQAWRDGTANVQKLREKARLDYLRKVQDAWHKLDLAKMDPAHAQMLTARLHAAHAVRDLGF